MNLFVLLILAVLASEKNENAENGPENGERIGNKEENPIFVKIEEDDAKVNKKSKFIGVTNNKNELKWRVQRWSRNEKRLFFNGCYDDEETAAHASDTLARNLMNNGELKVKLNFPDDHIEIYPAEKSSKYIGVTQNKNSSKWQAQRWGKNKNTMVSNGCYDDEETAAHASDTLARKLMENGEQNYKINFPDDLTEVYPEVKSSKYIGVSYDKKKLKWKVQRLSKYEKTQVYNGSYDDEETAAHASDTLGRKLMENGDQGLKLNFPDAHIEVYSGNRNRRKRPKKFGLKHLQNN